MLYCFYFYNSFFLFCPLWPRLGTDNASILTEWFLPVSFLSQCCRIANSWEKITQKTNMICWLFIYAVIKVPLENLLFYESFAANLFPKILNCLDWVEKKCVYCLWGFAIFKTCLHVLVLFKRCKNIKAMIIFFLNCRNTERWKIKYYYYFYYT